MFNARCAFPYPPRIHVCAIQWLQWYLRCFDSRELRSVPFDEGRCSTMPSCQGKDPALPPFATLLLDRSYTQWIRVPCTQADLYFHESVYYSFEGWSSIIGGLWKRLCHLCEFRNAINLKIEINGKELFRGWIKARVRWTKVAWRDIDIATWI